MSAPLDRQPGLERELIGLLRASGISEFKWADLAGAKERFAAQKMCSFAVDRAAAGDLRVDVLIWDIEDRRHRIRGRDDVANLQRMYYHLFRNVLRTRWPMDAVWRLHPDEHTAMNWETVHDCLEAVALRADPRPQLTTGGAFRTRLRREFRIEEIQPARSGTAPLLQLADLFSGLGVLLPRVPLLPGMGGDDLVAGNPRRLGPRTDPSFPRIQGAVPRPSRVRPHVRGSPHGRQPQQPEERLVDAQSRQAAELLAVGAAAPRRRGPNAWRSLISERSVRGYGDRP